MDQHLSATAAVGSTADPTSFPAAHARPRRAPDSGGFPCLHVCAWWRDSAQRTSARCLAGVLLNPDLNPRAELLDHVGPSPPRIDEHVAGTATPGSGTFTRGAGGPDGVRGLSGGNSRASPRTHDGRQYIAIDMVYCIIVPIDDKLAWQF